MRKLFILGTLFFFSVAMLMTACMKDETNYMGENRGNNNGGDGTDAEYVDLGLPCGTKWKTSNETGGFNDFYTFYEALIAYGKNLPTKEQLKELKDNCTWEWQNNGSYKVTGTNGNSIVLPAAGNRSCEGDINSVGKHGFYWSSSARTPNRAWSLDFNSDGVYIDYYTRCDGQSVRLVQY